MPCIYACGHGNFRRQRVPAATAALLNMPENPATFCLEVRGTSPPNLIAFTKRPISGRPAVAWGSQAPSSPAQVVMHIELTIDISRFPFPVMYEAKTDERATVLLCVRIT